jgi:pimeloyl-ACP methyl ester carboxylesterase
VPIVAPDRLYTPPDPLPAGEPGDVIQATEPVALEGGGTEQRILYVSTTASGEPTAVSGALFVPAGVAPDAPVLTLAHGTIGLADCAAPSRDPEAHAAEVAYFSGLAQEGREDGFFAGGAILVASDMEGLGTPGVHRYLVGRSEGAGTLDAVRAARSLTGTAGDAVVVGHSQGGGAALWAAQMAADYAPDANLVGAVAAAPAVELARTFPLLDGSDHVAYLLMAAAGFRAADPGLVLEDVMTPAGLEATERLETQCDDTFDRLAGGRIADHFTVDPTTAEPFATMLAENTPGDEATDVPTLVVHGEADEQLPVETVGWFLERACGAGSPHVALRTFPGADHHSVLVDARPAIHEFVTARLAGDAPTTDCP